VQKNYLNEVQKPDEDDSQTVDTEELVLPFWFKVWFCDSYFRNIIYTINIYLELNIFIYRVFCVYISHRITSTSITISITDIYVEFSKHPTDSYPFYYRGLGSPTSTIVWNVRNQNFWFQICYINNYKL